MSGKQGSLASKLCQPDIMCFEVEDSYCSRGNVRQMAKESETQMIFLG